jgi:signal transduction histidine kinase
MKRDKTGGCHEGGKLSPQCPHLPRALHRWLCGLIALLGLVSAQAEPIHTLSQARAQFMPQPKAGTAAVAPAQAKPITLSHRWDEAFPGRDGSAIYTLTLPALPGTEPRALLFTRVGNQADLHVNGQVLTHLGQASKPLFDAAKTSWLVTIPASMLKADGSDELRVSVRCQAGRWGGLSHVQFGSLADLEPSYRWQRLWRFSLPVVIAAGLLLMGLIALGLWWRQHVALYGWFSLAALTGLVRHLDRVWLDIPLPWPWLGALVAIAYACHLTLIARLGLEILGMNSAKLHRAFWLTLVAASVLAALSFGLHRPLLWTLGLAAIVPYGLWVTVRVAQTAWQRRSTRLGAAMVGAVALLALSGVSDFLGVKLGLYGGSQFSVMPVAVFLLAILVTALIVARYNAMVEAYRTLNAELSSRVEQREGELKVAFEAVRESQREQAVTEERQRMMREIHDGVGAHLVLLQNMAEKGQAEPQAIGKQATLALEELRMAVDSMQPVHGDLATVLATMRYRLLPRLEAAGLKMSWDVDRLPPMPGLTPQAVLQVHRILLEALTNVLRHARAQQIDVQAHVEQSKDSNGHETSAIVVTLIDDGVGIGRKVANPEDLGHGLANMHSRARSIGALLTVTAIQPQGTQVRLVWPLDEVIPDSPAKR